ncbi:DUF2972 domain-containing protein [Campylobacter coli]|nr:DUF2972 domain-containing protein [Campylobacter coli]
MFNPNSAIDRIKNQLSYKLGRCIIQHKKIDLTLIYNLYKIKRQHKLQQKYYKNITNIFPELTYPKLENCKDYDEGCKIKLRFTYILGQALVEADKNKFKGGYLKLIKDIKNIKKNQEIVKKFANINPKYTMILYSLSTENKQFIIDNSQCFNNIIDTHKDYQAIIDTIIYNLDFFIKNFDSIYDWIMSKKFFDTYKNIKHSYPALLDPDKLNDTNQKTNYKNICPEDAWNMNLPLPGNYKFMLFRGHGSGGNAMREFLSILGLNGVYDYDQGRGKQRYINNYIKLLNNKENYTATNEYGLPRFQNNQYERDKFFAMFQKNVPIIFQLRDPIEMIKHAYGRKWHKKFVKVREFDLSYNFNDILEDVQKYNYPLPVIFDEFKDTIFLWKSLISHFKNFKCYYLDISEIRGEKTFATIEHLSKICDFRAPHKNEKHLFERRVFGGNLRFILPLTLYINKDDLNKVTPNTVVSKKNSIVIQILHSTQNKNMIDLTSVINKENINYDFGIYISDVEFENLKKDNNLYQYTLDYIKIFTIKLQERVCIEDSLMLKPEDVLEHLSKNKEAIVNLKNILDEELSFIKQEYPNILNSWKYYQDFEKIYKDLNN